MKRCGFSLIELTAVTTVASILLGIVVTVMILLEKQDIQLGLRHQQAVSLTQLADQFRADVQRANTVRRRAENEPASLIALCESPEMGRIEYHQEDMYLVRQQFDSAGQQRNERFLLPALTEFELLTGDSNSDSSAQGDTPTTEEKPMHRLVKLVLSWPSAGDVADKRRAITLIAQSGKLLPVQLSARETDNDSAE